MNFVDKLIDKIYVDKTFLKLGLYETQCIVKLCVSETAKYLKNNYFEEYYVIPEGARRNIEKCQDLINQCEVNNAE